MSLQGTKNNPPCLAEMTDVINEQKSAWTKMLSERREVCDFSPREVEIFLTSVNNIFKITNWLEIFHKYFFSSKR